MCIQDFIDDSMNRINHLIHVQTQINDHGNYPNKIETLWELDMFYIECRFLNKISLEIIRMMKNRIKNADKIPFKKYKYKEDYLIKLERPITSCLQLELQMKPIMRMWKTTALSIPLVLFSGNHGFIQLLPSNKFMYSVKKLLVEYLENFRAMYEQLDTIMDANKVMQYLCMDVSDHYEPIIKKNRRILLQKCEHPYFHHNRF
jgi:hypothetical protein